MTTWSYSKWYCFGHYFKMILLKTSTLVVWMASVKYLQSHLNFLSLKTETIGFCASEPLDSSMVNGRWAQRLKCLYPPHTCLLTVWYTIEKTWMLICQKIVPESYSKHS